MFMGLAELLSKDVFNGIGAVAGVAMLLIMIHQYYFRPTRLREPSLTSTTPESAVFRSSQPIAKSVEAQARQRSRLRRGFNRLAVFLGGAAVMLVLVLGFGSKPEIGDVFWLAVVFCLHYSAGWAAGWVSWNAYSSTKIKRVGSRFAGTAMFFGLALQIGFWVVMAGEGGLSSTEVGWALVTLPVGALVAFLTVFLLTMSVDWVHAGFSRSSRDVSSD